MENIENTINSEASKPTEQKPLQQIAQPSKIEDRIVYIEPRKDGIFKSIARSVVPFLLKTLLVFALLGFFSTSSSSTQTLTEVSIAGQCNSNPSCKSSTPKTPENKLDRIASISLEGNISSSGAKGTVSSQDIKNAISYALSDSSVKAILLYVDSGGGEALESSEMYFTIKEASEKKPVYAYINSIGASGSYYASLPSKAIYANPEAMVGSIGAVLERLDYSEALSKIGVKITEIKTGENKDLANPAKPMTEQERSILSDLVTDGFSRFKARVIDSRKNLLRSEDAKIFSGAVFTPTEAKRLGMIDDVARLNDVITKILDEQKLDKNNFEVFVYQKQSSEFQNLLSGLGGGYLSEILKVLNSGGESLKLKYSVS